MLWMLSAKSLVLQTVVMNVSQYCTYRSELSLFVFILPGESLPLPSLRLLVPPLQLMMASMWQVLRKQDVLTYWTVAEYVSLVVDTVPDLLMHKHRLQLLLGLRARVGPHIRVIIVTGRIFSVFFFAHFLIFLSPVYSGVVPK